MEDIIDIIVTETTNTIEITSQPTDEIIDVNIIDNREDVTLNVTPTLVEININSLTGNFGILWGEIEGTLSNQTDLNTALGLKADLVGGKVPSSQLPSYVDDVVEVANYAALPATGETGKIYVTIDTNYIYRWTGSVYVEIKDSSAVWGAITGTLSNQTDLQNALNAKDAVLTFSSPLSRSTNTVSIPAATTSVNGYLTSTDWTTFNAKQPALNGTGFVKISGTTISYDNSTYLTTSSAASTYLPLGGGELTGALLGTSAAFSGYVGIGNSSPLYNLDVTGSGRFEGDLRVQSTNPKIYLTDTDNNPDYFISNTDGTFTVYDVTNSASRLTIGTSGAATFLNSVTASSLYVSGMTAGSGAIYHTGSRLTFANYNANGVLHFEVNGGTGALTLNADTSASFVAGASFGGALSGTSATFSDTITSTLAGQSARGLYFTANQPSGINWYDTDDVEQYSMGIIANSGAGYWGLWSSTSSTAIDRSTTTPIFKIARAGAATFSSSVSGISHRVYNGATTIGYLIRAADWGDSGNNLGIAAETTLGINFYTNGSATPKVIINSSGNVGIGTTSPTALLHVVSASTNPFIVATSHATTLYTTYRYNSTTDCGYIGNGAGVAQGGSASDFGFQSINNMVFATGSLAPERMRITSSGNVGIGTTTINEKLDVEGNFVLRNSSSYSTSLTREIIYRSSTISYGVQPIANIVFATVGDAAGELRFITRSSAADYNERMRITSGGNVLIGTTSDSGYGLIVGKTRDNGWQAAFVNAASAGTAQVFLSHGEGYGAYIDSGSAGNSSARYIFKAVSGGSERFVVRGDGHIQTNGNPVYAYSGSISIGGTYQTIFAAVSGGVYLVSVTTDSADGTFGLLTVINDPDKSLGMIYGNNISLQFSGDNVQMKSTNGSTYNTTWTATRLK